MKRTLALFGLATLCLSAPAAADAAPGGTWTGDDLTKPTVSWSTGGDPAVAAVRVVITQNVSGATTGAGQQCAIGNDRREVVCDVGIVGGPSTASSGTIAIETTAAVACGDQFAFATDHDGRGTFKDAAAITPSRGCPEPPAPPAPGPPPPPQTTGDVNTTVGAGVVVAPPRYPVVVGADKGGGPHVKAFAGGTLSNTASFFAFDPNFQGGVRVAVGDVTGDGRADAITGAGAGAGPHVKVFDGATGGLVRSFFAYSPSFNGGVYVGSGDVNGDGKADIITGAGSGAGPHVKVFDGVTGAEVRSFNAYGATFSGGVTVAGGDVNGDGKADIITGAGAGGGPHVKVFNGATGAELRSFAAFTGSSPGGVYVGSGDVNSDGKADIVVGAGAGAGPLVRVFDGATGAQLSSLVAFDGSFAGGVRVATGDVNGDGRPDVIAGAGPGGGPQVRVLDAISGGTLRSINAFDPGFTGGVFVGAGDPPPVAAPRPPTQIVDPARGTFKLSKLLCPARVPGACTGKITLTLTPKKRAPRAAASTPRVYGKGTFKIAPGKRGSAKMTLNSFGLREMTKNGRLALTASVVSKDGAGNATSATMQVTVKAAKAQR